MSSSAKIRVINGPNLNLLGKREPDIYGHLTLDDIASNCQKIGAEFGVEVEFLQSNHEGELVDWIQQSVGEIDAMVINAAAYTHTSVAIHDALRMYKGLSVELHISNPHNREEFRHNSFVASAVDAVIAGLGVQGYEIAVRYVAKKLTDTA